ncbi:AAA family ATPase [Actimicrobium antarcticum]|uniref:AAA family ATPase n=1 Tax=Actimicrobium antarcticum TaxID=1051899 RepID=A0ABP7SGR6_9BURK
MKILAIRGCNLASLAGDFAVDFEQEPLKSAGLFAISGPTGAGKSTLLDALCMALYENTPRLIKAGNKNLPDVGNTTVTQQDPRNLLRRGTAEGYAEVDFVGNDDHAYRARWSVRRARGKVDGGLQKTIMSLHRLPGLQPIGGTSKEVLAEIVQRIGLTFEQFTRAVLLAQNEFSAFLKADDNDRGELLETLTGSTIYSTLSQRAFARARLEQDGLQRLNDRLADQSPLDDEARSQLEQQSAAADSVLANLGVQHHQLDVRLRWHLDDDKLCQNEQSAHEQLRLAREQHDTAQSRRTELERIDAVQPARALVTDVDRLTRSIAANQLALTACRTALESAGIARVEADLAAELARRKLLDTEQAQFAAAPQLDRAKALDARIDALLPVRRQALQAKTNTENATALLRHQHQERQCALDNALHLRHDTEQWLALHTALQPLAHDWPRWDVLLTQSAASRDDIGKAEAALVTLSGEAVQQRGLLSVANQTLTDAGNVLARTDQQRQQILRQHAGIDIASITARKMLAERRRDQLTDGEQLWRNLVERQLRAQELDQQSRASQQAATAADTACGQISAQIIPLAAALAQAERALRNAEAACAASVETLRDALDDQAPCPVCGATEHPYANTSAQLHALLASLHKDVADCRQQHQHAQQQHGIQIALAASHQARHTALALEQQQVRAGLDGFVRQWQEHAISVELTEMAASERADWFTSQRATLDTTLLDYRQQETAWQQSVTLRDEAQAAFDVATSRHVICKDSVQTIQTALTGIESAHQAMAAQLAQCRERLAASLNQLDAGFATSTTAATADWRRDWHTDPQAFHAQCADRVGQWQTRHGALDLSHQNCATLTKETTDLLAAVAKAGIEETSATRIFTAGDNALDALKAERQQLFSGDPVQQVESQLASQLATAKTTLAQLTQLSNNSSQLQARHAEALDQATTRQADHAGEARAASDTLADWITRFPQASDGAALSTATLHALLARSMAEISTERAALHAIDVAVQQANSVHQERSSQRQAHQQQKPSEEGTDATTIDALRQALQAAATEREAAQVRVTEFQLALRQDQARRVHAADLLDALTRQKAVTRVWAQLNDLIGAADGKKFRNYAQQFTLDVLLGYANHHLNALSRRYRLQRIPEMLGMVVIDQDMGDEMRSVHSLSGGESFLVSLALALGLASLSSNRVRVESLFIDEGFGSLDADTLSVAMAALDGLQSMGRKVGVISHVQEMTERIATTILVERLTGGSSRVVIC